MIAISMTPTRRFQLAGLGYALIGLAPMWKDGGPLATLAVAACCGLVALLLLRAAAAGLKSRADAKAVVHPVQSGKPGLRILRRLALATRSS